MLEKGIFSESVITLQVPLEDYAFKYIMSTQIYLEGFKKQNKTKSWVTMEEDRSGKIWVKGKNDQGRLHEPLKEHTHTLGGR